MKPDATGLSRIYIIRESFNQQLTQIPAIVREIRRVELEEIGQAPRTRIMDPNFGGKRQSLTGRTVRDEYARAGREIGWPCYFVLGNDDVEYGHAEIRKLLSRKMEDGKPQLQIFRTCYNLIEAMRYFQFKENYSLDIRSEYKHFIDALRYLVTHSLRYKSPGEDDRTATSHFYTEEDRKLDRAYSPDPVTGY